MNTEECNMNSVLCLIHTTSTRVQHMFDNRGKRISDFLGVL